MDRFEIAINERVTLGAALENICTLPGELDGVGDIRVVWLVDSVHTNPLLL